LTLSERDAWIALAAVEGVGDETLPRLISQFRSARQAMTAALDGRVDSWNVMLGKQLGYVPIQHRTMLKLKDTAANPQKKLDEITAAGLWT
jgi:hypothetical protein